MTTTGFSFKKDKSGEAVAVPGKKKKPHRVELISDLINKGGDPSEMFFNFQLEDCENASNAEMIKKENDLFEKWEKSYL